MISKIVSFSLVLFDINLYIYHIRNLILTQQAENQLQVLRCKVSVNLYLFAHEYIFFHPTPPAQMQSKFQCPNLVSYRTRPYYSSPQPPFFYHLRGLSHSFPYTAGKNDSRKKHLPTLQNTSPMLDSNCTPRPFYLIRIQ